MVTMSGCTLRLKRENINNYLIFYFLLVLSGFHGAEGSDSSTKQVKASQSGCLLHTDKVKRFTLYVDGGYLLEILFFL